MASAVGYLLYCLLFFVPVCISAKPLATALNVLVIDLFHSSFNIQLEAGGESETTGKSRHRLLENDRYSCVTAAAFFAVGSMDRGVGFQRCDGVTVNPVIRFSSILGSIRYASRVSYV